VKHILIQEWPARLTRSAIARQRVADREVAALYFFFRRLVFLAPFLAAAFVFLFFAMLPS
jgi:hypothetical protein